MKVKEEMFLEIQGLLKQRKRQREREEKAGKRDGVRGGGNLISLLIKPNLFWRVTETASCHYADLQRCGRRGTSQSDNVRD